MFETTNSEAARGLWLVPESGLSNWLQSRDDATRRWLEEIGFGAGRHEVACLAAADGKVRGAVLGLGPLTDLRELELWHLAGAPGRHPGGAWKIKTALPAPAKPTFGDAGRHEPAADNGAARVQTADLPYCSIAAGATMICGPPAHSQGAGKR